MKGIIKPTVVVRRRLCDWRDDDDDDNDEDDDDHDDDRPSGSSIERKIHFRSQFEMSTRS